MIQVRIFWAQAAFLSDEINRWLKEEWGNDFSNPYTFRGIEEITVTPEPGRTGRVGWLIAVVRYRVSTSGDNR